MTDLTQTARELSRKILRVAVSILVAAQIPAIGWLAGLDFQVRSGELAVTYAATIFFAIFTYACPAWTRDDD